MVSTGQVSSENPSRRREIVIVVVLALGFGLVGIDRFLISTLFPTIAKDLNLNYSDIGTITGALSFAWGLAALYAGNLSDHIGRRLVLTVSLIVFALLIGGSGLATNLTGLVLVRIIMGFADGAFTPASISATLDASPPERHGRNVGAQQQAAALFGLGFAPLLVSALLHVINWRWIFSIFVIPGLILAWLTWRVVPPKTASHVRTQKRGVADWLEVIRNHNVRLLMVGMLLWLTMLSVVSALLPSYFLDHLHMTPGQMGAVMSATGFGAAFGTFAMSWLSDKIGRKPVMLISTAGTAICALVLTNSGPNVPLLALIVFVMMGFNNALVTQTIGPMCTESVSPSLMATASGLVIAIGEFFGGGLAPMISGQLADHFGIEHILWLPFGAACAGFVLCMFLRETLVRKHGSVVQTVDARYL